MDLKTEILQLIPQLEALIAEINSEITVIQSHSADDISKYTPTLQSLQRQILKTAQILKQKI